MGGAIRSLYLFVSFAVLLLFFQNCARMTMTGKSESEGRAQQMGGNTGTDGKPFPNASNTGVPAVATLTPSAGMVITVDGTVIDSMLISGCIDVQANNVTIKNSRILGGSCTTPVGISSPYHSLLIQDSEIDGQNSQTCQKAVGISSYSLLRVNIHGCSEGLYLMQASESITIQDSYIHDLVNSVSSDAIQFYQFNLAAGGVAKIVHNTLEGGGNSSVFIADNSMGNLILDSNLLMGGGYVLRLYDMHAWVTNNVIYDNSGGEYDNYPYWNTLNVYSDPTAADPGTTIEQWTNNHTTSKRDGSVIGPLLTP